MTEPILEDPTEMKRGTMTAPIYVSESSTQTHYTPVLTNKETFIINNNAFKGRWGTQLVENSLLIPREYESQLRYGGVITAGLDTSLLLFGKEHWVRMERIVAAQLGIDPKVNDVMRHLYGRAEEFDLDRDGRGNLSIKVSDDLIGYAGLRRSIEHAIVVVGLIWWAEVYDADVFAQSKMSASDVRALAQSLA